MHWLNKDKHLNAGQRTRSDSTKYLTVEISGETRRETGKLERISKI